MGSREDRARLRAELAGTNLEIVDEAPTLSVANESVEADAILLAPGPSQADRLEAPVEPLTPREIEVLELMAEGLPNKGIAKRLSISDQTVKFHVSAISGKLGASNRTDAVRRALRRGLITL